MSASDLGRWGALAAIVGGALSVLFAFLGDHWAHVVVDAARHVLLVVGITGLYFHLRQSPGFGRLGAVGFYVCILVFALIALLDLGILVNEGMEEIYLALGPVRGLLLPLGLLLFGAAVLRAERLPLGGAWMLIAAALTSVLSIFGMIFSGGTLGPWVFIVPTVLFGLGWAWLGYGLYLESSVSSQQAARNE